MYKKLVIRLWHLLRYPAKSWDTISLEPDSHKSYLSDFYYPLIGLAAFTAFLSPFFFEELTFKESLTKGIQYFILAFGSAFVGLFLAARVLDWIFVRWFQQTSNHVKAEVLIAYASAPILVVSILTRLIKEVFFLKVFFLYAFIIVWEAATHYYAIDEKQQGRFTSVAGLVILAAPYLIEMLLKLLLPGLK